MFFLVLLLVSFNIAASFEDAKNCVNIVRSFQPGQSDESSILVFAGKFFVATQCARAPHYNRKEIDFATLFYQYALFTPRDLGIVVDADVMSRIRHLTECYEKAPQELPRNFDVNAFHNAALVAAFGTNEALHRFAVGS